MAKSYSAPSKEILEAALHGLEAQREKLNEQIAEVRSLLGRRVGRPVGSTNNHIETSAAASTSATRKKRSLSPEARKRIAAAQKKRWAAFRKTQS